jgi:hypothetical protein
VNPVDRFNALLRHVDYRNDPRLQYKEKVELENYEFSELFGEDGLLVHYNEDWWIEFIKHRAFLRIWGLTRAVDPQDRDDVEATLSALVAGDHSIFDDDVRAHDASEDYYKPDWNHDNFVELTVDLERPTEELLKLIRKLIDAKRKEKRIRTKRTKSMLLTLGWYGTKCRLPAATY